MDVTGSLLVVTASVLLWWIYRRFIHSGCVWQKAGIPYISFWASNLGFFPKLLLYPFHEIQLQGYRNIGKLYGSYFFNRGVLNVGEPDVIRQIIVKDFQHFINRADMSMGNAAIDSTLVFLQGERWKQVRTIVSPTFSSGKIKKMTSTIMECADTLRKNFGAAVSDGNFFDVKRLFGAFSMDAIASTAFSTKVDSINDPDNPFIVNAKQALSSGTQRKMLLFFPFHKILKLLKIEVPDFFGSRFFGRIALKLAEERKSTGKVRDDYLQILLEALENNEGNHEQSTDDMLEDEEIYRSDESSILNDQLKEKGSKIKGMSEQEFVSQCIIFFIGGYEAIASTLSFAAYELALHQEVQETLIAEVDEVLRDNENQLTYENIQSMKILDCVVNETLRKYPPSPNLQRVANSDCTLGDDRKIKIPKGTIINIMTYSMHHDPNNYPDPEKFDPQRFTQEQKAARNPYVYLPFGAGPRHCIAMRFALFEVKLCLANLLRYFRFHRCPKTPVPLRFTPFQSQLQAMEIFLTVEKREDGVI